jgi:hypothetical protein
MKIYRGISLIMTILFAATGILFLAWPDSLTLFFNQVSFLGEMQASPVSDGSFYLVLAAGYMYLVTILAFLMFKYPGNRYFPLLLIHGKLASSLLSLFLFLLRAPYQIFMANFIVDGIIGIIVIIMYLQMRKEKWAYS